MEFSEDQMNKSYNDRQNIVKKNTLAGLFLYNRIFRHEMNVGPAYGVCYVCKCMLDIFPLFLIEI